jgi:hypothetical protein
MFRRAQGKFARTSKKIIKSKFKGLPVFRGLALNRVIKELADSSGASNSAQSAAECSIGASLLHAT